MLDKTAAETNAATEPASSRPVARRRPVALTRRHAALGAIILVCIPLHMLGCGKSRHNLPKRQCLLIGWSQSDPLWPVLKASAEAYVSTVPGLNLKAVAPQKPSTDEQIRLTLQNITRSTYAVCLQTLPDERMEKFVSDLASRGLPVVLIGRDMPDSARFGYVGWDEHEVGRSLAEALSASLKDRSTFMLLHAGETHPIYGRRLGGFRAGLQRFIRPKMLKSLDCKGRPDEAFRILCEQGKRYPNLGAWVVLGEWFNSLQPAELRKCLSARTALVLVGATPETWPLVEQGICKAAIGTNYGRWGYEAVSLCEMAFHQAAQPGQKRLTRPEIVMLQNIQAFKARWAAWLSGRIRHESQTRTAAPRSITVPISP